MNTDKKKTFCALPLIDIFFNFLPYCSLMKNWRNTYIFAKSIAEELVNSMRNELPVCVVRPAVGEYLLLS